MKHLIATVALIALAAVPLATFAGQDEAQRQITQRLQEQKLKLAAAEKAQGAEREKLMQEHMKMMQQTMTKMQAMSKARGARGVGNVWRPLRGLRGCDASFLSAACAWRGGYWYGKARVKQDLQ
jgi:Flp pilus assembly protein TadB